MFSFSASLSPHLNPWIFQPSLLPHLLSFLRLCQLKCSIGHPFLGDYVRLRQNPQWRKICTETNDQYVVFADIINKITRSSGKVRPKKNHDMKALQTFETRKKVFDNPEREKSALSPLNAELNLTRRSLTVADKEKDYFYSGVACELFHWSTYSYSMRCNLFWSSFSTEWKNAYEMLRLCPKHRSTRSISGSIH